MASTSTSKEISFSRSSMRRMLRSMSIRPRPSSRPFGLAVELDLHERLGHVGVGDLALLAGHVEGRPSSRSQDAAGQGRAVGRGWP